MWKETLLTGIPLVLGVVFFVMSQQSRTRAAQQRPAARRAPGTVKRSQQLQPHQRRTQQPTLAMSLGFYFETIRTQFAADWRRGRMMHQAAIMSRTSEPIVNADPVVAPAGAERERERELTPELAAPALVDGDIITKTINKRQAEVLVKKYKPLVDSGALTITDIAVLMGLRTSERSKQVEQILDTEDDES